MAKVNMKNDRTQKLMLTALFSALVAVGAFIKVPVPVVPFTMQMCFVNMAGLILGGFYGGLSVLVYVLLGLIGIPIFAHGGGPQYVLNPTFGYLVGMVIAGYACGYISHFGGKVSWGRMILGTIATFIAVYSCGLTHAAVIAEFYTKSPIPLNVLFTSYFALFLPGDISTCIITIIASMKLIPILERQGYQVASGLYRKKNNLALATVGAPLNTAQTSDSIADANASSDDIIAEANSEDTVANNNSDKED